MSRTKSGYITLCQQLLALALVVAALTPAASVVSLDIVREGPGGAGLASPYRSQLAAYVAEAQRTSLVPAAPVDPTVREVPLTAPAGAARSARRLAATTSERRESAGTAETLLSSPQPVTGYGAVGITWQHGEDVADTALSFAVRTRTGEEWSAWQDLPYHDDHGPDPGSEEAAKARPGTDPLLVGDVDDVQVRATTDAGTAVPDDLTLAVIDPGEPTAQKAERPALDTATMDGDDGADSVEAVDASSLDASTDASTDAGTDAGTDAASLSAAAYTPKPVIYSRAQWGADESMRDSSALHYGEVHAGFVHHTVNANDYTRDEVPGIIRGIYAYHTKSRGWSDVGYNYLVDRFGRIWEGRYGGIDRPVVGAHTLNYNDYSFAMSAIGNYEKVKPSSAVVEAYGALYAWKLSLHGVSASSTRQKVGAKYFQAINGHRDAASTACPGKYLYARIPDIRRLAAQTQRGWTGRQLESNLVGGPYPDLIVRRASDKRLLIVPTGGLQSFAGARSTSRGWSTATRVQLSPDLTGDGAADLISVDAAGVVRVHAGTGQGDFATTGQRQSSTFAQHDLVTAVGDLDADGYPDVVARRTDGTLDLWRGRKPTTSDGKRRAPFASPVRLDVSVAGARQLLGAGDLDGNGRADLGVIDSAGALQWRRSSAKSLALGAAHRIDAAGTVTAAVGGGDWTGDGVADLVVRRSGKVQIMPGRGDGTFGAFRGPFTTVNGGSGLVGGVDVAGASGRDLLYRDGDSLVRYVQSAAFDTGTPIDTGVSGATADRLLHAGDWDRDGFGDVIYRSTENGNLFLRRGDGTGRLGPAIQIGTGFRSVALLAAVGDMTGDGWPDLMGQPSGGSMRIYPGRGTKGLGTSYVAHSSIKAAQQIAVGRWDGDGSPDSLFRNGSSSVLYRGNGPGGLMTPLKVSLDLSRYDWVVGVGSATLGSRSDLLVRTRGTGTLSLIPSVASGASTPRVIGDGLGAYDLAG